MRRVFVILVLFACLCPAVKADDPRPFVSRSGLHLMDGDQRFYFLGASCYYLAYWASDTSTNSATGRTFREDADAYMVRCRDLGFNAIRIWAFNDGDDSRALQPSPGVHSETALRGYDYVLHRSSELGLRIVMTLVNNWDDYGGMRWYVTNSPTASVHSDFYTDAQCRAWYQNHVTVMATRTNTFNARVYREDPTIFAWQLANEPRWDTWPRDSGSADQTGETVRQWIWDMAAFVKSVDTNHLVSTGEEGWTAAQSWEGTLWENNNASPNIDYTVIHCWPDWWDDYLWGSEPELYSNAMAWVTDHLVIAEQLGKPMILSEYGKIRPLNGVSGRHAYYEGWFNTVYQSAVADGAAAGLHFWMLEADGSDHDDGFSVFPGESETLTLLSDQAWMMNHLIAPGLTVSAPPSGGLKLDWSAIVGAPHYEVQVASNLPGGWFVVDRVATNTWTDVSSAARRFYRIRPYWP